MPSTLVMSGEGAVTLSVVGGKESSFDVVTSVEVAAAVDDSEKNHNESFTLIVLRKSKNTVFGQKNIRFFTKHEVTFALQLVFMNII